MDASYDKAIYYLHHHYHCPVSCTLPHFITSHYKQTSIFNITSIIYFFLSQHKHAPVVPMFLGGSTTQQKSCNVYTYTALSDTVRGVPS